MTLQQQRASLQANRNLLIWLFVLLLGLCGLMLYRLGTLTPGLSSTELQTARQAVGWHGILQHPLDLPLKFVRSLVFFAFPDHGQLLTRLPNVVFGGLSVLAFGGVVGVMDGPRPARI